jgi:hypothetical protein
VAIGTITVNSNFALDVAGAFRAVDITGTSSISSGKFLTTSDSRLKNVIEPLSSKQALDALEDLTPLTYSWRSRGQDDQANEEIHAGLLAQEVKSAFPLAVQSMQDVLHIDNTALLAYVIAAVKAIRSDVRDIQNRLVISGSEGIDNSDLDDRRYALVNSSP